MKIIITGGAGFVGSSLAVKLKQKYPQYTIFAVDNLVRRGSELNLPVLIKHGIIFKHADIRIADDLTELPLVDIIIDASADPSVLAGIDSSTVKLIQSNLWGTVNLLELAYKQKAKFIFLSTSRVYPFGLLNEINLEEQESRFELAEKQSLLGISIRGIAENFSMTGARSFYGAAKLSSELLIQEYIELKGLHATILRCGVIAGPGQFGKIDQGVVVFWLANHFWKKGLGYFGFGGTGKQVRDILHIEDLFDLMDLMLHQFNRVSGKTLNVGGGLKNSISLVELTKMCETITGNKVPITNVPQTRAADIPFYITDNSQVYEVSDWSPQKNLQTILLDTYLWIKENEQQLKTILVS